jgi:hypothetical protein
MRYLLLVCLSLLFLEARENPFKPIIDNTVLPVSSNRIEKAPPFKEARIQLPVDARVLTSVAVYYQSIDGSIKKEIISIDRSIDWHKPLILTQEEVRTPPSRPSPEANVTAASQPTGTSPRKKEEMKREKTAETPKAVFKPFPFVTVEIEGKEVHIITKDEKIRSLHLVHPFKIAVDFKRTTGRFLTRHKKIDFPPYTDVAIGNHNGFYRIVVTYDAPYKYRIEKTDDGYVIRLR